MHTSWRDCVLLTVALLALGLAGCGKKPGTKPDVPAPGPELAGPRTEAATTASARTWTDVSGEFSVQAYLVEVKDKKAILKKTDSKVISVPLEKLSTADRQHVLTGRATRSLSWASASA